MSTTPTPLNGATMDAPTPTPDRAGRGFLAVTASIFLPGLGQFLAGRRKRGLRWFAAILAVAAVALAAMSFPRTLPALIVLLPVSVLLQLAMWVDAFRCAAASQSSMLGQPWKRFLAGIAFLAITVFLHPSRLVGAYFRDHVAEGYTGMTQAMYPTLQPTDRIAMHRHEAIRRWDIVTLHPPQWQPDL